MTARLPVIIKSTFSSTLFAPIGTPTPKNAPSLIFISSNVHLSLLTNWYKPCHEKTCLSHMHTTKAHPHSLISTFVVWCLGSIIPIFAKSKFWRLVSLCRWAGRFESYLVEDHEDCFSHVATRIKRISTHQAQLQTVAQERSYLWMGVPCILR